MERVVPSALLPGTDFLCLSPSAHVVTRVPHAVAHGLVFTFSLTALDGWLRLVGSGHLASPVERDRAYSTCFCLAPVRVPSIKASRPVLSYGLVVYVFVNSCSMRWHRCPVQLRPEHPQTSCGTGVMPSALRN
jgi:hypothetical protein